MVHGCFFAEVSLEVGYSSKCAPSLTPHLTHLARNLGGDIIFPQPLISSMSPGPLPGGLSGVLIDHPYSSSDALSLAPHLGRLDQDPGCGMRPRGTPLYAEKTALAGGLSVALMNRIPLLSRNTENKVTLTSSTVSSRLSDVVIWRR